MACNRVGRSGSGNHCVKLRRGPRLSGNPRTMGCSQKKVAGTGYSQPKREVSQVAGNRAACSKLPRLLKSRSQSQRLDMELQNLVFSHMDFYAFVSPFLE